MKMEIASEKIVFMQEEDCCGSGVDFQELSVEWCDGGGGKYPVIQTDRWAFDSIEELEQLLRVLKSIDSVVNA